MKISLK
jgi:chaperonin GroEL